MSFTISSLNTKYTYKSIIKCRFFRNNAFFLGVLFEGKIKYMYMQGNWTVCQVPPTLFSYRILHPDCNEYSNNPKSCIFYINLCLLFHEQT